MKTDLLIIDPQNDFCDKSGSLYVPGADEDMNRLAKLITKMKLGWNDIHITLDSHHKFSIFHPCFIKDKSGKFPDPFTTIMHQDVVDGIYRASLPMFQKHLLDYTKDLETYGRNPLVVWPYHCLIATWGSLVYQPVMDSLLDWENLPAIVDKVTKGSNYLVEHYSAVKSEVEIDDPNTKLNMPLINTLDKADLVLVGGEVSTHCVLFTVSDICDEIGEESLKKIVILEDAMSPVPGFEQNYADFKVRMKAKGVQFSDTKQYLS